MSAGVILIVDDEVEICELVSLYLAKEGYRTFCVHDGISAIQAAMEYQPDLILLDNVLPDLSGVEVCAQLRRLMDVPILFMSCKGEESDKVVALGIGGDDYIVKPFGLREVVARIKAHLRRKEKLQLANKVLRYGSLCIDTASRCVWLNQKKIKLSGTEFDILLLLAQHPGMVFSAEDIFRRVWSAQANEDVRTVTVHVSNLRKKIETNPAHPAYILTAWGTGYQFNRIWTQSKAGKSLPEERQEAGGE